MTRQSRVKLITPENGGVDFPVSGVSDAPFGPHGPFGGFWAPKPNFFLVANWVTLTRSCKVSLESQYPLSITLSFLFGDPTPGGRVMGENPL